MGPYYSETGRRRSRRLRSGTRIRTLIARSRIWRPAIRRSPSECGPISNRDVSPVKPAAHGFQQPAPALETPSKHRDQLVKVAGPPTPLAWFVIARVGHGIDPERTRSLRLWS